jgi:hypothetical protein
MQTEDESVFFDNFEKESHQTFYSYLENKEYKKSFQFGLLSDSKYFPNIVIRNEEEAKEVYTKIKAVFVLSGYIVKDQYGYKIGINILNAKEGELENKFYITTKKGGLEGGLKELSVKVLNHLYKIYDVPEKEIRKIGFSPGTYLGLFYSVGYFVPLMDWWETETGIVQGELGLRFERLPPVARYQSFRFSFRPLISVWYGFGINKPELIRSYYHQFQFRTGLDLVFEFHKNYILYTGFGAYASLDVVYQFSEYGGGVFNNAVAPGIYTGLGFEYWFGKSRLIGIGYNNHFSFTFYSPLYIGFSAQLYLANRFPARL